MTQKHKVFKSRLAKRFFVLFVSAALIPIIALATVAYYRVTRQLTDQALDRLHQAAKSQALDIYERLTLVEHRFHTMEAILPYMKSVTRSPLSASLTERNRELFTGLMLSTHGKDAFSWGEGISADCRKMIRAMNLARGATTLMVLDEGKEWPTVAMVRNISRFSGDNSFLIGTINPSFLWGLQSGTGLPPATEFSVWDDQGRSLFSSLGVHGIADRSLSQDQRADTKGRKEMTINGESYYVSSWSPFMKPRFHIPYWTIMVMQPRGYVLQPLSAFRTIFFCVVAVSFLIVVFLTNRAIRRSLMPIGALMDGARKVAQGLFSHHVVVKSNDEFQDLAAAFNNMTDEIDTHFKALAARSDLDSTVLSVLNMDQIILTSLEHSYSFIPHAVVAVSIFEKEDCCRGYSYIREKIAQTNPLAIERFRLSREEHALLLEKRKWLIVDAADDTIFPHLDVLRRPGLHHFIVFPVWVQNRLFALFSLGIQGDEHYRQRDLEYMRGFVDHLSIAFANSNLIQELRDLNVGTLHALARTVDAKSPWTAGHSVRVAQITLDIARVMGLSQETLDDLQCAALLHDIGKIGIPQDILDKPGRLTDAEYDVIKTHPSIGARILGPIRAYERIIPIVEQHHERYDGKGYPFGKFGEETHVCARIMALADAFDAMVSDRPYRTGLLHEQVLRIIQEEAGHQFDPHVVEAFNQVMNGRKEYHICDPLPESFDPLRTIAGSTSFSDIKSTDNRHNEGKL